MLKIKEATLRILVSSYSLGFLRTIASGVSGTRSPEKWVFILGCYNSGTTILKSLLDGHHDIRVLPKEGVRLTGSLVRPEDLGWTRMWIGCPEYMVAPPDDKEVADRIIRDWSPWWRSGGNVFIEKSIANLTRVEWLERHFSNAYFIGITRDGYAVTEGIRRRARPQGVVAKRFGNTYPLSWAAKQWVDANSRLLLAKEQVEHYHQISYEELVNNPADTLAGIFNFIGDLQPDKLEKVSDGIKVGNQYTRLFDGNDLSFQRLTKPDLQEITDEIESMQCSLGYPIRNWKE